MGPTLYTYTTKVIDDMKKAATIFLPILVTFVLIEGLLWLTPFVDTPLTNKISQYLGGDWPYTSKGWAYRYLKGDYTLADSKLYEPHGTRGWVFRPNLSFWVDGYQWTTNPYGHRSLNTPSPTQSAYKVFIAGDSQTAGDEVDDIHVWPNQLQVRLPDISVINAAVSGYSFSQMLISALEEYPKWQPDLIVLAVIEDDLYRSALTFRSGPMPTIDFTDGLKINLAIQQDKLSVQQAYFSKLDLWARKLNIIKLFIALKDRFIEYPQNKDRAYIVNYALLDELLSKIDNKTKVLLTYLPYPAELTGAATNTMQPQYHQLCNDFANKQLTCLHLGDTMKAELGDYRQGGGHYHRKGNLMVANALVSFILQQVEPDLPSQDTN